MVRKEVRQHDKKDCGAACLATICNYYGRKTSLVEARELAYIDKMGVSVYGIIRAAESINLVAEAMEGSSAEFFEEIAKGEVHLPIIAHVIIDKELAHFVVIRKISSEYVYIFDPAQGRKKMRKEDFSDIWTGIIIAFQKAESLKRDIYKNKTFGVYAKILKCEYKKIIYILIFSLIIAAISILGSLAYRKIIDEYILKTDMRSIENYGDSIVQQLHILLNNFGKLFVVLILLYIFQSLLVFSRGQILNRITKNINYELSKEFYNHLLRLPLHFFQRRESGEIINRFQSIVDLQQMLTNTFLTLILETAMAIVGAIILVKINKSLFLLVLIMVFLYAVFTVLFIKPINRLTRKLMECDADVTTVLNESIDGIEMIKADVWEARFLDKFIGKIGQLANYIYKLLSCQNMISSIVIGIESIGILLILWKGSALVMAATMSLGSLIAFESLVQFFVSPIKNLIEVQSTIQNLVITIDRLNDVFGVGIENGNNRSIEIPRDNSIHINELCFAYGYREPIVIGVNLQIDKGSMVGIIGESGSGKSTLMKIIASLQKAAEGQVYIGGIDISTLPLEVTRKFISYVPQTSYLFTGTLRDNIMPEEEVDLVFVEEVINSCGLHEVINNSQNGLDTVILENGSNLSGGQRQKVAIARAILRKPKILLLDEATSNLDVIAERNILRYVTEKLVGITVVSIFHNMELAAYFEKIVLVKEGTACVQSDLTDFTAFF